MAARKKLAADFTDAAPRKSLSKKFRPVAEMETPHVPSKDRDWTVFAEALKRRTIYLNDELYDGVAEKVIATIRTLENQNHKKPIHLIINTPGGVCSDGFAIIDTIRNCRAPVHGYVYGLAASMGSLIIAACNKRYAAPNAEIMIHQPWNDGVGGKVTEIDIAARDMRALHDKMVKIYAEETALQPRDIRKLIEYDNTLNPEQAKKLGLIDEVMTQDLHFKIMHGRKVPDHKRPRHPQAGAAVGVEKVKSTEELFRETIETAAARRKPSTGAGNDNPPQAKRPATAAEKKTAPHRARKPR